MDLAAYRADRAPRVEAFLEALLPSSEIAPQSLHAAMRHAVLSGGKRLRPLFAMAAAEAVGAAPERRLDTLQPSPAARVHGLGHGLHLQGIHPGQAADALLVEFDGAAPLGGGGAQLLDFAALAL